MPWNLALRFTTWLPPAIGAGYLAVLGAAAAARQAGNLPAGKFLDARIAELQSVSPPYLLAFAASAILIWALVLYVVARLAAGEREGPIKLRVRLEVGPEGTEQNSKLSLLISNFGNKDAELFSISSKFPGHAHHQENTNRKNIRAGDCIRTFEPPLNNFKTGRVAVFIIEYRQMGKSKPIYSSVFRFILPYETFIGNLEPEQIYPGEERPIDITLDNLHDTMIGKQGTAFFALDRAINGEFNVVNYSNEICVFEFRPDEEFVVLKRRTKDNDITLLSELWDTDLTKDVIMIAWDDESNHAFLSVNGIDAPVVERSQRPPEASQ